VNRFQAVVHAMADLALAFFPDLFDRQVHEEVVEWLKDRACLEQKDPYLCSAIGNGTKP